MLLTAKKICWDDFWCRRCGFGAGQCENGPLGGVKVDSHSVCIRVDSVFSRALAWVIFSRPRGRGGGGRGGSNTSETRHTRGMLGPRRRVELPGNGRVSTLKLSSPLPRSLCTSILTLPFVPRSIQPRNKSSTRSPRPRRLARGFPQFSITPDIRNRRCDCWRGELAKSKLARLSPRCRWY